MGSATVDLPDPLQNTGPAEAKSADDLLAQMAGDEIDRLLAETEGETASVPSAAAAPATPAPLEAPASPATEPSAQIDLDAVLETAAADRSAAAEPVDLHEPLAVPSPPVKHTPQIELGDPIRPLPLLLRPLEWISSPLDPWPDQLREILGKIGLMTLINALAVLAYVFLVRRHHH